MAPHAVRSRRTLLLPILFLILVSALLAFVGCSSNDKKNPVSPGGGGTPSSTTFTGFITDGVQSGKITVTVNTTSLAPRLRAGSLRSAVVTATGAIKIGATTTLLEGTYDADVDSLHLDGGGWSLEGIYGGGGDASISGEATSPNGPGFFACANFGSLPIKVYTGKYFNQALTDSGTWDMATYADTLVIVAYNQSSDPILLTGLLSGSAPTRTITAHAGDLSTYELDASGTLNTTSGAVGGSWTYTSHDVSYGTDDNGDWSGQLVP